MTQQHPITPPQELVQQWYHNWRQLNREKLTDFPEYIATQAARWGADQELEACCEWLDIPNNRSDGWLMPGRLRAARRPKPPSLKEQALRAIGAPAKIGEARVIEHREHDIIRRALEALPDD